MYFSFHIIIQACSYLWSHLFLACWAQPSPLQVHCFQNCSEHREKQEKQSTQDHINTGMLICDIRADTWAIYYVLFIYYCHTSIQPWWNGLEMIGHNSDTLCPIITKLGG